MQTYKYVVQEMEETQILICDAEFENENGSFVAGSHSLTLWTYFTLKTLTKVFINVMYNITDGAASTITIREHASYAMVLFFPTIGGFLDQL